MVLGKNSIFNLWTYIIVFNIFIAVAFTFLVGFNNLADAEIMTPIHGAVSDIAEEHTSTAIQDNIDKALSDYRANQLPWDLIIFGVTINFYFFILWSAIQVRKANPFIILSMLTFGMIFLLLLISVSIDVQEWVLNEIYTPVFEDLSFNTPLMDWFFANIGMISFILALVVILVNQFDKLKVIFTGGQEE